MCVMSSRLEALPFKWHDHIRNLFEWRFDNSTILHGIREKLAHFEGEFPKLKEATITLELTLWKLRTAVKRTPTRSICGYQEKARIDKSEVQNKSEVRRQCRVTCGALILSLRRIQNPDFNHE